MQKVVFVVHQAKRKIVTFVLILFLDLINKDATQNELQQRTPAETLSPRDDGTISSLKSACDTVEVFDIVKNQKNLSPDQVMQALRTLFSLQKSGKYVVGLVWVSNWLKISLSARTCTPAKSCDTRSLSTSALAFGPRRNFWSSTI
jgi:hypothetical protein